MRSVLLILCLLLPTAALTEEVTQFPIAGKLVEVPVAEGYCAATDTDLRETPLKLVLGNEIVRRTRPLALHLECEGLESFRSGVVPEAIRARYWSLIATAPDSLHFDANHLATYEAMLGGLSNPNARDLFGKNLIVGAAKENFKPSSIVIETRESVIGGSVVADVLALGRWRAARIGLALIPVRSRLLLAATVQTEEAEDAADFNSAYDMIYAVREPK